MLCLAPATSLGYAATCSGDGRSAGAAEPFVSDIFHEVDEEVRREQLKKLWDRYGIYLIALAVLVVVGGRRLARLRMVGRPRRPPKPAPRSRPRSR